MAPLATRCLTFALALLLAIGVTQSAFACSMLYPPGYDHKRALIEAVERARNILEIEVVRSSVDMGRPAIVRVAQVLKGGAKEGAILRLKTAPTSICGAGQLLRGQSGWTILHTLDPEQVFFSGFLTAEQIAAAREGSSHPHP